jgi:hypothetical protein
MFTIGCDPEFPLSKNKQWVSAIPLVKGTKKKPWPLPRGGKVMRDNVAIEFGVEPAKTKGELIQRIGEALVDMKACLPKDVEINLVPSATFPREELKHPEARAFGCEPDLNAWTGKINGESTRTAPRCFRSFGGHVHIGYLERSGNEFLLDPVGKQYTARMCDVYHGIVFTTLDNSPEAVERRNLYGKPGCYRETDYGIEYRVLSNYWCKSPKLVKLVYDLTHDVLTQMRERKHMAIIEDIGEQAIQDIIMNGDKQEALDVINGYLSYKMSNWSLESYMRCWYQNESFNFKDEWKDMA